MQSHCQIPTPLEYVNTMLDLAGYKENLYGRTVLENSCGEGSILVEIVRRYITDCRNQGLTDNEIQIGLNRDIKAFEIEAGCVQTCKIKLDKLAMDMGLDNIHWNIEVSDYLKSAARTYDYIIGNPPYITYHDLQPKTREELKKEFVSCGIGRFDYCYAFIEKSVISLNRDGVLVYLVPFSIFRNKFAQAVRNIIKEDIISIIDYSGISIFDEVTASAAIIHLVNGSEGITVNYRKAIDNQCFIVPKDTLLEKWFFEQKGTGKRFGDYFTIQNSIATLYNKAFLINEYIDDCDCILVDDYKIEKAILRDAVSTKSCKKKKRSDKIIFPYRNYDGGYSRIPEDDMWRLFPGALTYIQQFAEKLNKRKCSKGVLWYEYGRTQALGDIYGKKLIISMVITDKVTTYMADAESIPYAGYFIKPKKNSPYDLSFAKKVLEAPEYMNYIKKVGTPTTATSYRISVKEVEDYIFED